MPAAIARLNIVLALLLRVLCPRGEAEALLGLALRLAAGAIFVGFGLSKFTSHAAEAAAFDRYGLPFPALFAYAVGSLEVSLGVLLVLGFAVRPAATALAGNMAGAIATGGRVDGGFVNLVLAPLLLIAMLVLLRTGAGRLSVDGLIVSRFDPRARGGPSSVLGAAAPAGSPR